MFDEIISIDERILIIKTSTLDDAIILDTNYRQLIRDSGNEEQRMAFRTLRSSTKNRIQELTS